MVRRKAKYQVDRDIEPVYAKAWTFINSGEYDRARRVFLGLLEVCPDDPCLLNSIGVTYFREGGEVEKAERYFREALKRAPDFAVPYSNLSSLLSTLERFEESAKYARRAIEYEPESAEPWMNLGLYYARLGDLKSGLEYFLAAYNFDLNYVEAAYNAACAFTALGRIEDALEYLEKAIVKERCYKMSLTDPALAPLRELPEFQEIMKRAGNRK
ncbi:MAG: tetratricopeptide repeat protein [Candidatus Coatesbacteria bacterium]|nr:MAG: tetratricopeptide repeat protein [Candidatus Coatesbacteria bacterium]